MTQQAYKVFTKWGIGPKNVKKTGWVCFYVRDIFFKRPSVEKQNKKLATQVSPKVDDDDDDDDDDNDGDNDNYPHSNEDKKKKFLIYLKQKEI